VKWAAALKSFFPESGIVADIRGAWPEELLFDRGFEDPDVADSVSRAAYELAIARLQSALGHAAAVFSVSPDLLNWLSMIGAPQEKLTYVPCCVPRVQFSPDARERLRTALGMTERLVFAYLGTVSKYQHIHDGLVPFFRALIKQCPSAHLLCLTSDPQSICQALAAGGLPLDRATVLCLPHDQVAAHLCAADAGLLLRAPSRMNKFSRPTKLAEYLACGLPVVLSRGMGETDSLVERAGAGIVIDAFSPDAAGVLSEAGRVIAALAQNIEAMRANALALARSEFLWACYTDRVRSAYYRALNT